MMIVEYDRSTNEAELRAEGMLRYYYLLESIYYSTDKIRYATELCYVH